MSRWQDEIGNVFDTGDAQYGWMDKSSIPSGKALAVAKHDDRHAYNPPAVIAPATDQAQFDYDMNREVELAVLATPSVMAHRVEVQAQQIADQEKRLIELERLLKQTREMNYVEKPQPRTIIDP